MDGDPTVDNYERYDVVAGHEPSGTSVMNMKHWKQMLDKKKFEAYDYGSAAANNAHYGQPTPPLYDVSTILFYIRKDKSSVEAVRWYVRLACRRDRLKSILVGSESRRQEVFEDIQRRALHLHVGSRRHSLDDGCLELLLMSDRDVKQYYCIPK